VVASVIFVCFVPESPRWLLLRDPKSSEGRHVLNYIAWFNGSSRRVSDDAVMDNFGQLIRDKRFHDDHQFHEVTSVMSLTLGDSMKYLTKGKNETTMKMIAKDIRTLFCNSKYNIKQLQAGIFCSCAISGYFLVIFNAAELKGNALVINMIVSASLSFGALISPLVAQFFSIRTGVINSCIIICISSYLAKFGELDEYQIRLAVIV
jgi:hypothetical protein